MAAKKKPAAKKAAPKKPPVGLVPQIRDGKVRGAIYQGAPTNPRSVGGRPRSALRDLALGSLENRFGILENIADGEAVQRIEVPLHVVLKHATCLTCGGELAANSAEALLMVKIEGRTSAAPKDRIAAVNAIKDISGVTNKEIPSDVVRDKLQQTIDVLRGALPAELVPGILAKLAPVWKS